MACNKQLATGDKFYLLEDGRVICKEDYAEKDPNGECKVYQILTLKIMIKREEERSSSADNKNVFIFRCHRAISFMNFNKINLKKAEEDIGRKKTNIVQIKTTFSDLKVACSSVANRTDNFLFLRK